MGFPGEDGMGTQLDRRELARVGELRLRALERRNAFASTSARIASSFIRMAEALEGDGRDTERARRYRARAAYFEQIAIAWSWPPEARRVPDAQEAEEGLGGRAGPCIDDLVDTEDPEVARGSAFGRALTTARGWDDLGSYLELLAELKRELSAEGEPPVDFLLGLVGSLSLISAVLARSAERSGLVTESGQPLLVDLFARLAGRGVTL